MKKVLVRVERAVLHVLVSPKLRPLEDKAAVALAKSVAARVGIGAVVLGAVLDVIQQFLG